jgi:co-chaperonin GroES (HSP10)
MVRLEPVPEQKGLVIIANKQNTIRVGRVLSTGPGREKPNGVRQPTDVQVGERVAFFEMNLETPKGKQLTGTLQELEEGTGFIQDKDILFALGDDDDMVLE